MTRRIAALLVAALLLIPGLAAAQVKSVTWTQVSVTPNSSAYSAGQCIGGVLTVGNMIAPQGPGGTILTGVTVVDPAHQSAANDAMTLLVFNKQPTGTYTDHANCQVAAADAPFLVGVLSIASGNCVQDQGPTNTVCTITPTLPLASATLPVVNSSIFVVPVAVATPTYGASATLFFNFFATPFQS